MNPTHTLLLTDVVGSTQLAARLGDTETAALWAAHDRAARDLLPRFGGREIDKTDGMLLLFGSPADAVAYAAAYAEALSRLPVPLQARAGLHVGPAVLRENRPEDIARGAKPLEVDGVAKPTTARVMALAGPGQLLVTPSARAALAGGASSAGWQLHSHGHWVFKGLGEPQEVFECLRSGDRALRPEENDKAYAVVRSGERWVPLREVPHSLPQPLTRFIGRERELADLQVRLGSARLITLLGMGGLGKTRLALQLAAENKHLFPDGAWFIDLAPLREPSLVVAEAARALGLREEAGEPLLQTLCSHLKPRRVLLIVDNCEHLLDAAGDLVHALLQAAPSLQVLASSRELLDVPGEHGYPLQPLPLPGRGDNLATLASNAALRLFLDRAAAHRPDFALGEGNAEALASLVARLEGIPLAIELAAARLRNLDLDEIRAGLEQRFHVLTGGSRRLQARQQTLQALVDWSYELLAPAEQALFRRLGVFAGGFDLDAVQAVCADPAPDTPAPEPEAVAALLASLVQKSLVQTASPPPGDTRADGPPRWQMLETLLDYARDKLGARSGPDGEGARAAAAHAAHFFGLAKQAREGLKGGASAVWMRRLDTEIDNLRRLTARSLAGELDPFIGLKTVVALQAFWIHGGHVVEARAMIDAALALPAVQAAETARAHALYVGAALATSQGDHVQARRMLESCLQLRRSTGHGVEVAATLSTLAQALLRLGEFEASRRCEEEALALFRAAGDRIGEAIGLQHLGQCAMALGDDDGAAAHLQAAAALAADLAHAELQAECALLLGDLDAARGDWPRAERRALEALAIADAAVDRRAQALAHHRLARAALATGRLEEALEVLRLVLRACQALEMRQELLEALEDQARLLERLGRPAPAASLAAAINKWRARGALDRLPREEQAWQAWWGSLRDSLAPSVLSDALLEGRAWELDEAVERAAQGAR